MKFSFEIMDGGKMQAALVAAEFEARWRRGPVTVTVTPDGIFLDDPRRENPLYRKVAS